jgi:hypothetical protein
MKRYTRPIRSERGQLLRSAASADRSMPAILSTGLVARDNHTIDVNGWKYGRTVPLVDSHRDADGIASVLGKVSGIHVGRAMAAGDSIPALLGTLSFAEGEVNPAAEVAFRLYSAGHCDSVSVSFIPLEYTAAHDRGSGALNIFRAELLEVSAVVVPSDSHAKVYARAVRAQLSGHCTTADRAAIAAAIANRVALDDSLARGETAADRDRAAQARRIRARIRAEDMP